MKMTSVLGHMMELEFREDFRKWSGCSPEDLFTAPVTKTVKKDMDNVAQTLREESRGCGVLLLWLDCDLEGENIAFEVISVCKSANPNLRVYRARFSALIPRDVFATLRAPDVPNRNMSEAGHTIVQYCLHQSLFYFFSFCLIFCVFYGSRRQTRNRFTLGGGVY